MRQDEVTRPIHVPRLRAATLLMYEALPEDEAARRAVVAVDRQTERMPAVEAPAATD
jgi:hypothetical protein